MSFENDIVSELSKVYPDAKITVSDVVKSNGGYRGLIIQTPGSNVAPTIQLDQFEKAYEAGDVTFPQVVARLINTYDEAVHSMPETPDITKETVLEKVEFRLLNKDRNQEIMFTSPHEEWNDLILVPYMDMNLPNGDKGSARITTALMESLGLTEEEVFKACIDNARPVVKSMRDVMKDIMLGDMPAGTTEEDLDMMLGSSPTNMYVCSNKDKSYGAAMFMLGSVMEDISSQFDDNVVVLPSSVHEVILVPASLMTPEAAREMVGQVNEECVSNSDFLSDNVYCYDREKKDFREFTTAQEI